MSSLVKILLYDLSSYHLFNEENQNFHVSNFIHSFFNVARMVLVTKQCSL